MGFTARYIFVKPPSQETHKQRLSSAGLDERAVQSIIDQTPVGPDQSKTLQLFDHILPNDDTLETVSRSLSAYIFGKDTEGPDAQVATGDAHNGESQHRQADGDDSAAVARSAAAGDEIMEDVPGKRGLGAQ